MTAPGSQSANEALRRIQSQRTSGESYAATNVTATRSLNASSATTANVANVLGTLIEDLQAAGLLAE